MTAIEACRTAALGGHVEGCQDCGHRRIAYNSCRNRHCPKCQAAAARDWLEAREADLLPVGYFHVVFSLPAEIADIAIQNKAAVYDLLFRAASQTMLTIAADPRHLGARIGITAVLHSWGSALTHHPHIHMIVPGGGISLDGQRWVSSRPAFLLPVRVLGKLFRRLFLTRLVELFDTGRLRFFGKQAGLSDRVSFQRHLAPVRKKSWIVYSKPPFAGPAAVLAYLSRYTHRVAISNRRLIALDDYRKVAVIGLSVIAATFGAMGLWAAFTPLSAAVVGAGTVTNDTNKQTIQHYEGGIVRSVLIHEGQHVAKGEKLFELDSVQAKASLDISRNQLFSLVAKSDRLRAEREGASAIRWSPELAAAGGDPIATASMQDEQRQFVERRATTQSQLEVLKSRIGQYQTEMQGIDEQRNSAVQQAAFLDDEISGLTELYKQDLVPKPRLLALQRDRANVGGQIGRLLADKARAQKAIGETTLQMRQIQQQFQQEVSKDSAEVQTQSTDIRQRFTVASDQARRVNILAPVSGTVQGLRIFTTGAVVRQAEPLVEIAPDKGDMVIQARFSPSDIDSLRPGMRTELRFSSFHDRTIPVIFGEIRSISQDRVVDEVQHAAYYLGIVHVNQDSLPPRLKGRLKAGMPVDVTVPIGARTALEYIYQPLTNAFQKSFRER